MQLKTAKDIDQLVKLSDKETFLKKLREMELENLGLRKRVWRLQYRGTLPMGIALASAGGISLLFSYLYSSFILTFIGLGLTLWGALIFYVSPTRYVREEIVNAMPLSMIKSINDLVVGMGYKGKTIFFHPKHLDELKGYVFIPYDVVSRIPKDEQLAQQKIFCDDPKGIFVTAPSQGLVELFEKELNVNFATVDLTYLQENLPKLLNEDLRIIDKLSIEKNDHDMIEVKIVAGSYANMCQLVSEQTQLGHHLGCPLCSSVALLISKVSGKPVTIAESIVKNDTIKTTYLTLDL
ncbi:MAG: hypothetical protein ACE5KA_02525 [Nitrososphaerales archaeon]